MKHIKLMFHRTSFDEADLVINPKDFPDLKVGDIVEIYHPEDELTRLLLQVTTLREDLQGKGVISVETSVANAFQLKSYTEVVVKKVDFDSVVLDSVELIFKDQYLGRSEMWRLKKQLVNSCVYYNKKFEFYNKAIRAQVYEMWSQGERVACGVISEDTKLVFRSSTSMVYLFLQMSSEMWEFDVHGDLYFEKAVNGFLSDLFQKWKKNSSNHEVTIVLFSRVYYKATNLEEFPEYTRECLQKDFRGHFYEDFYRVAVQNEKYEDWTGTLVLLQTLFADYRKTVLEYHKKPGYKVPNAFLSSAAHGNFLEVLNISLNVFEKHYLERSLDRTGQLVVVISPGVGVFEVDRELTNVTKQRIIDNGVGCDLVCVGEQPLHAVPLFKFHNKDTSIMRDDYSMPHWINLSFYSSNKKLPYSTFVPRIRLPSRRTKSTSSHSSLLSIPKPKLPTDAIEEPNLLGNISTADVDFDAYDSQVFTLPSSHIAKVQKLFTRTKKLSLNQDSKSVKWKLSDPDIYRSQISSSCGTLGLTRSTSIAISSTQSNSNIYPNNSFGTIDYEKTRSSDFFMEEELSPTFQTVNSSTGSSASSAPYVSHSNSLQTNYTQNISNVPAICPGRALINPFDPSHVTVKMTSNRRRWTHVFPKGPTGVVIQRHHYQSDNFEDNDLNKKNNGLEDLDDDCMFARSPPSTECRSRTKSSTHVGSPNGSVLLPMKKTQTLLWGVTGEQEWTPALTTGVDWKSLIVPACLPITTDFFPDEVSLKTDYVFSDYNLLPDDVNADYARKRAIYRDPLKTPEVFRELISQRLAQGFQLIVESDSSGSTILSNTCTVVPRGTQNMDAVEEYKLSIGRIFHKISLCRSEIRITRYRPRHPYPPFVIQYRYRFQAPDHNTYGVSWVSFNAEKLENFNWNYLDHYICTRGDTDFQLVESCKYWRFRVYALPSVQPGTKKIHGGSPNCDVYDRLTQEEKRGLLEGFLKFIESPVNKIKRMTIQKQEQKDHLTSQLTRRRHSTGIVFLTRFQEKYVAANRMPEKNAAVRSGSKVIERQKISPAPDVMSPVTVTLDNDCNEVFESIEIARLKENATTIEIVERLSHPIYGIEFLSKYPSLPSFTFISYDAVQWMKNRVEGITCETEAVKKLEKMREDKLICHASGDFDHPFIFGFYLYYIPCRDENKPKDYIEPIRDLVTFKNEWAEIETLPISPAAPTVPAFLLDELPDPNQVIPTSMLWSVPAYKQTHLEVDIGSKSERIEWGHARYHSVYSVDQAFELVIEWVAASGSIISELIYSFNRKAQSNGLHLIPVPADPHALPYSLKSDPLRGPVFVPLDIECLMDNKSYLFEEYPEDSWPRRLLLLQEEIAIKFGFISCKGGNEATHHHNQYVHLTGNVFLLIATPSSECSSSQESSPLLHSKSASLNMKSFKSRLAIESNEIAVSPHQEYITRHVTDHSKKSENRIGYLWSWNHMIGRRWKGTNLGTNDEAFQDKLLHDFRQFCSNADGRLKTFWKKCHDLKTDT
ncbi:GATOR complex protein Iml1 isoform X2 [Planococcus citri]|uniref:GATOR complex protein Iml1 isoform X2 n=1 Tax=Planococcus citri TaxID=170843 RepID=UPI0031F7F816